MSVLWNGALVIGTVVAMEGAAWAIHKYVMHGPGWGWHRSHHEPHDGLLERNDAYALLFGALSLGLIAYGARASDTAYWIGVGMAVYGALYFVVHDGLVHQRWPFRYVPRSGYLKRLVQAHRLHHAVEAREDCVSFGFLYAPPVGRLKKRFQDHRRRSPKDGAIS